MHGSHMASVQACNCLKRAHMGPSAYRSVRCERRVKSRSHAVRVSGVLESSGTSTPSASAERTNATEHTTVVSPRHPRSQLARRSHSHWHSRSHMRMDPYGPFKKKDYIHPALRADETTGWYHAFKALASLPYGPHAWALSEFGAQNKYWTIFSDTTVIIELGRPRNTRIQC
jgi:hypothetical protein